MKKIIHDSEGKPKYIVDLDKEWYNSTPFYWEDVPPIFWKIAIWGFILIFVFIALPQFLGLWH